MTTTLTDQKIYQEDGYRICIVYFVLFATLFYRTQQFFREEIPYLDHAVVFQNRFIEITWLQKLDPRKRIGIHLKNY